MLGIVNRLRKKYDTVTVAELDDSRSATVYLFQKWAYRIPKGWYGFDLGQAPVIWGKIIDDFLIELEKIAPEFMIYQIKIKFGRICIYVDISDGPCKDLIQGEILQMEKWLFHSGLIF